jgi:hypothetical protein
MTRSAYSKPPGDQFQQSTFRTEKSVSGLPAGSDREKEQALPEGAATPNSVSRDGKPADKAQGVGQRSLPYGKFNGPESGSGTVEKSRTKPLPGEQYGSPSKDDYGYLTRRTMTGSVLEVMASAVADEWIESDIVAYKARKRGPSSYKPHAFGWRRHRQKPQQRNKRRKRYRVRRSRELQQAKRRYRTRYRTNPRFKRRRTLCRKSPNRCKMRSSPRPKKVASVEFTAAVPFLYGCDLHEGFIVEVTPEGHLVLELEDGTETTLSATAFVATVVFLDDADIDAVDYLIESSDADEPYGDPTEADVAAAASLHRVTAPVEGTPDEQLEAIFEAVMSGCEGEDVTRVAHDTFQYDKTPASELSNNWMNRKEPTREVSDTRPYKENAPGQWTHSRKEQTHMPSDGVDTSPNPAYYQGGSGKVIPDDMRLTAAWGPVLHRTAGIFQAPPVLVSAIERWAVSMYAGHVLAWAQSGLSTMRGDSSEEAREELADIRARFQGKVEALKSPGDTVVISAPKMTPGGTVEQYNIGVRLQEPEVYLLDVSDNRPTFRSREVVAFPKSLSGVVHQVMAPTRFSVLGQLEVLIDRHGSHSWYEDVDLVKMSLIVVEARRYTDVAAPVKSIKRTDIPVNAKTLSGWRYSDRIPDDIDARLAQEGLSTIHVELNFNPRQTIAGQWDRTTATLEVDIPKYGAGLPYPLTVEEFRNGIKRLVGTIRHESQHAGQDVLRVAVGLPEVAGLPPRDVRNLRYNPSGIDPNPYNDRLPHTLRDIEFFPRIQDEVDDFVRTSNRIPPAARKRAMDVWVALLPAGFIEKSEFGLVIRPREFFSELRVSQPAKWRRAVAEFVAGVEAAGVRVPTARGVLS